MIHHEHFVTLDNGVQTMSYTENGGSLEFLINQFLGGLLRNHINVRGGFIENDNSIAAKDSSDDADQLTLA